MKYLVTDIGGTFTKYAVMDEECRFYEKGKIPTAKESVEEFLDMLTELFDNYREVAEGLAISAPGMIDSERGFMYNAGAILCVENLDIVRILEERLKVPVTIENDAKSAALAEMWRGSLQGCQDAAVVILGTGIGGAVFCNGKLLRGRHLFAGEFSYLLSDGDDAMNPEKVLAYTASTAALIGLTARKKGIPREELDGEKVFRMVNQGDPEKIAIGGRISAQPLLIRMIREELEKICGMMPHEISVPEVTVCRYFNDSNLIGALYVHLNAE